jgi:hypothetical protein
MRHSQIALVLSAALFVGGFMGGMDPLRAAAANGAKTETKTTAKASAQLRKDWGLEDLKVTKKAVQGATFPQDIRKSAIDAIDSYMSQQEKLLESVDTAKDNGAAAKKSRASLESEFQTKMKSIYGNPEYKAELDKRIKALKGEMDDSAAKATGMFDQLNAGKSTTKSTTQPAKTTKTNNIIKSK